METSTKRFLRSAVLEALTAEDDAAALELFALLHQQRSRSAKPAAFSVLQPAEGITDGPAHDLHFWTQFIRQNFIPFITANGRVQFTSSEMLSWLENCCQLQLTSGDMQLHADGRIVWRSQACSGLSRLKEMGVVHAPFRSKEFRIVDQALAGNKDEVLAWQSRLGIVSTDDQ